MDKSALALKWVTAFNNKDIKAIMNCYSEAIEHISPKIANYYELENNTIKGKVLLEDYFSRALTNNPDLHFDLLQILEGDKSVVVLYNRMKTNLAGEFLAFNEAGLIVRSCSHYDK